MRPIKFRVWDKVKKEMYQDRWATLEFDKKYQVRMRGVSNCGTGEWTRYYSFKA